MTVLVITNNTRTDNGIGRYSAEVTRGLAVHGISCRVLSWERGLRPRGSIVNFAKDILTVRRAARSADIVHAFDGWPFGVYGWAAVLGTQKKLFVSAHGSYAVAPLYSFLKGLLLKKAYRRAKAIFCVSNYTKQEIDHRVSGTHTVVVFNGVSLLPEPSEQAQKLARKRFGISAGATPIVLTVGALKHRKGQLDTLKALALLKAQYPNFLYLVVGSDADLPYGREFVDWVAEHDLLKNVRVVSDAKDDETLAVLYSLSDVFVMTSNNFDGSFEGFGLVFLEGYQFGVPAVGSRDCGIEDAIILGQTGYLSQQGDHKDIAEKIERVLAEREHLSKGAREFVQHFSWEKTVEGLMEYY